MYHRLVFAASYLLLTAASLVPHIAGAQPSEGAVEAARALEGTTYVLPMNQFSAGEVQACGFEFKAVTFDNAYKRGAPVIINGSFALSKMGSQLLAFTYKLGTFNLTGDGLQPESPHFAWMKFGDAVVKPERSMSGENQAYKLYISTLPSGADTVLDTIIAQREVLVGFNRKEGGLDVVVSLDLDVRDTKLERHAVRTKDKRLGPGFQECVGALFASVKPAER